MLETLNGLAIWRLAAAGPLIGSSASASDLLGETYGLRIDVVVVPVARLEPAFLTLASGLAGEFIQKLQNYGLRLAFVGDISALTSNSMPLADFVRESNRHGQHVFAASDAELSDRLRAR
jgi:hypothetical protein